MKNLLYIVFIGSFLVSCSSDNGDMPANAAPSVPALVYPSDNLLCTENAITFEWSASTDAENNNVLYKFQVATDNQFSQGVINKQTASTEVAITLEKGESYYWRVLAFDSENAQSDYSPTYSFYTEGEPVSNHLPFLPELVSPGYDATIAGSSAILNWTASDPDADDILSYDVYLDTVNPPANKVVENAAETSLDVSSKVQPSTVYYWQVVVKDDKGGETQGQVWTFTTE